METTEPRRFTDEELDGVVVYVRHVQQVGCLNGGRRWATHHGYDFRDFIRNGIAAKELAKVDDLFAQKAVEAAVKESNSGWRR